MKASGTYTLSRREGQEKINIFTIAMIDDAHNYQKHGHTGSTKLSYVNGQATMQV